MSQQELSGRGRGRGRRSQRVVPYDQADATVAKEIGWLVISLALFTALVLMMLSAWALPAVAILSTSGAAIIAQATGRWWLLRRRRSCHQHWHHAHRATVFPTHWGLLMWEQVPPACALAGVALAAGMILLTPQGPYYNGNGLAQALIAVHIGMATYYWAKTPMTRRGRPALSLIPEGVWLWPGGRHETWIPWELAPELTSVIMYNEALVTTSTGLTLRFPMYCLPLSHTHLHHVLHHYSTHPHHRHELATPQGPQRIATLTQPPNQTEETPTSHQQDLDSPAPTP
ncbi:hypothetical protein [Actinomyces wuliandei]|uniref:hypothetical protein n=1 Tax=Actinomyces wuliandei TaxID=2057743 RepID=UPI0011189010|nr:hypothetical protein [Actinomyces wuliandei]